MSWVWLGLQLQCRWRHRDLSLLRIITHYSGHDRDQFNIKTYRASCTKRLQPRHGHMAAATTIFCLGRGDQDILSSYALPGDQWAARHCLCCLRLGKFEAVEWQKLTLTLKCRLWLWRNGNPCEICYEMNTAVRTLKEDVGGGDTFTWRQRVQRHDWKQETM